MRKLLHILPTKVQARIFADILLAKARLESAREPLPEPAPFALIQDDIKHIKLSTYIACAVHKDFKGLILAGEPNDAQLNEAWSKIQSDYFAANADDSMGHYLELTANIQQAGTHIANVTNLLLIIEEYQDTQYPEVKEAIEVIRAYPQYAHLTFTENIKQDIEEVRAELIEWNIYLERNRAEYKKQYGDKEMKEATEEGFYDTLDELRKFGGYDTPPVKLAEEMSVYDYCSALKRLRKHNEEAIIRQKQKEHGVSR